MVQVLNSVLREYFATIADPKHLMLLWKRSWQAGLRLEQLAFILLHPGWRHSLCPRHTPRTVSLSWHLPLQHCQGKVWYRSCAFVSLRHLTVSFTHSIVSMSLLDSRELVGPIQSPISMCTEKLVITIT
jgi:hypothetical protein